MYIGYTVHVSLGLNIFVQNQSRLGLNDYFLTAFDKEATTTDRFTYKK